MSDDERTPLLGAHHNAHDNEEDDISSNPHKQFCMLVGIPPSDLPKGKKFRPMANTSTLYERAKKKRESQEITYLFTASLSNTLLLSQVVLGAALTGLGASNSSHVLITVFGAFNTIIAGLVAYLKSRGQPMRAKMFRDDLDRVCDEIENSEIMWLGITRRIHGYEDIDVEDQVSVRSEIARLTRLYDQAVKTNTQNNPDIYTPAGVAGPVTGLKGHPPAAITVAAVPAPAPVPAATAAPASGSTSAAAPAAPASAPAAPAPDPDASPATAAVPPKPKANGSANDNAAPAAPAPTPPEAAAASTPAPASATAEAVDPDASPATTDPKKKTGPPKDK